MHRAYINYSELLHSLETSTFNLFHLLLKDLLAGTLNIPKINRNHFAYIFSVYCKPRTAYITQQEWANGNVCLFALQLYYST